MGQIAYNHETGVIIEAFSLSEGDWEKICGEPKGTYLMPATQWPAVPKVSINGLRFFAHYNGFGGLKPEPESYAHTRLKIDIVKAARSLGYIANCEMDGEAPDGAAWRADVLVTDSKGQKTAFEVQLSGQTLRDFRRRTKRYGASNVKCCWILPHKQGSSRLNAFSRAILNENRNYLKETGLYQVSDEHLLTLWVTLENKDTYPTITPELHLDGSLPAKIMPMHEAIDGILQNKPRWERPYWRWIESE